MYREPSTTCSLGHGGNLMRTAASAENVCQSSTAEHFSKTRIMYGKAISQVTPCGRCPSENLLAKELPANSSSKHAGQMARPAHSEVVYHDRFSTDTLEGQFSSICLFDMNSTTFVRSFNRIASGHSCFFNRETLNRQPRGTPSLKSLTENWSRKPES